MHSPMNLDSAKKKLVDGRTALAKAGDDPDLLGLALTKIHAALEDACRFWLSDHNVAQYHQVDVQNRDQVSWQELFELLPYCQWRPEDIEYVRRMNMLRNRAAHGEDFPGTRKDVEDYALYVENLLNQERQPLSQSRGQNPRLQRPEITTEKPTANIFVAYALWGLGLFGFSGVHRFYLGKPVTGFIWLFSYGFLFLGQICDLFLIPSMVKGDYTYTRRISQLNNSLPLVKIGQMLLSKLDRLDKRIHQKLFKPAPPERSPMLQLLEAASAHGKVLSIGQAVMMTGLPPQEVQELLNEALRSGLAHIDNDIETGAVRYHFDI